MDRVVDDADRFRVDIQLRFKKGRYSLDEIKNGQNEIYRKYKITRRAKDSDLSEYGYVIKRVRPQGYIYVDILETPKVDQIMKDNFDKCEDIGWQKFESLLQQKGITDYQFTEDKYCPVDCYFTSPTQNKWVVEIKVRDEGVDRFSTLFMELDKWKEMQSIINSKQADQGMYVNFIGDKCYIFCFSQIHPSYGCRLKDVYANRHTAINDGKRWKKMIEIPKNLSI